MKLSSLLLASLTVSSASAFSVSRRDALAAAAATALGVPVASANAAVLACPKGSNNCIRTTWTAPDNVNAAKSMLAIVESYPQEGQNKADLGGWSLAEGDLVASGRARYEFKSGIGNFAKFLNGNKPFVDDLEIEIAGNKVEIKSASRVGDSDFGVNQKRLQFLAAKATAMGFDAPEPKY